MRHFHRFFWYYILSVFLILCILCIGGYFSYEAYINGSERDMIVIIIFTLIFINCLFLPVYRNICKCKKKRSNSEFESESSFDSNSGQNLNLTQI